MISPFRRDNAPVIAHQGPGVVVNQATVTWRNGHTALRDASFQLPQGSITALLGVNGAGKSKIGRAHV